LKNLDSIQLMTSSYDNNAPNASRPWFEISIFRDNGDCIRVHVAADNAASETHYKDGVLVFGFGGEDGVQPVDDLVLREVLQAEPRVPDAASTFEDMSDKTTDQVMIELSNKARPILARSDWSNPDEFVTHAEVAREKMKNVLLVLDAEDLSNATDTDRRLSWGQTVENIWNNTIKVPCDAIWQKSEVKNEGGESTFGNNYFHLLIQLGLEGAIYKGFQKDDKETAHLIYEPTSAKGSFLRSYSDKDMENLRVSSQGFQVNLLDKENLEIKGGLKILENQGQQVKEMMKNPGIEQVIVTLRDDLKRELRGDLNAKEKLKEKLREKLWENLRKQLRKEVGAVWMKGLKSSLQEESAASIAILGITQIRDAIMTGIRWSRRGTPMMFPKGEAKQSQPEAHRLKLETDSEPVLVSVELKLELAERNTRVPLVLKSLPCSPQKAAVDTLKQGFECALPYMPSARFGNLITADRGEVDGFRKIANKVHEWHLGNDDSKPLSIAVFGQPGSGKSFGVKEVIKSILAANGKRITDLEFNLSQFRKEEHLRQAFEVIRGKAVSQEMPVVFFDEFDSTFNGNELGWLSHFIEPITQGKYQDGEEMRPLGRGIYIFIGGTKTNYEDFFSGVTTERGDVVETIDFDAPEAQLTTYLGALQLDPRPILEPLVLDVSSMSQYDDLKKKFYKIRDIALEKKVPLVFRNFDSDLRSDSGTEKLGWLKYFLAPMQDGEFFDHGSRHPLGRAIFVFEQGKEHFNGFPKADLDSRLFPGAKLPDFVSRLRGQVQAGSNCRPLKNILTWYLENNKASKPLSIGMFRNIPDRNDGVKKIFKSTLQGHVNILGPSQLGPEDEVYFPIRRAILLRSMLERIFDFDKGKLIDMDDGVLNALLFTSSVLHGARSLESILSMSRILKGVKIAKDDLCKEDQRILHVNNPDFQAYLEGTKSAPATTRNEQHYAWIERKSGRSYKREVQH
ncbi:hypothetical protein BO85DRAFT_379811, partial [Aspergillus piperis CBS 112811]